MQGEPLAGKWRPRVWDDVVGQDRAVRMLRGFVDSDRRGKAVPRGIILWGVWGVGKTTLARVYANALNCESGSGDICGVCSVCKAFLAGSYENPYYWEVDAARAGNVEEVRRLRERLGDGLVSGRRRVVVLDEAQEASREAQTALLTVLEDMRDGTAFVFCTTDIDGIIKTIRSRTFPVQLDSVSGGEVARRLQYISKREGFELDDSVLKHIIIQTQGHMRDAVMRLEEVIRLNIRTEIDYRQYIGVDLYELVLGLFIKIKDKGKREEIRDIISKLERGFTWNQIRDGVYFILSEIGWGGFKQTGVQVIDSKGDADFKKLDEERFKKMDVIDSKGVTGFNELDGFKKLDSGMKVCQNGTGGGENCSGDMSKWRGDLDSVYGAGLRQFRLVYTEKEFRKLLGWMVNEGYRAFYNRFTFEAFILYLYDMFGGFEEVVADKATGSDGRGMSVRERYLAQSKLISGK